MRIVILYDRPHVERLRESIGSLHELTGLHVEPRRADEDVPLRHPRTYAQLSQLDRRLVGQADLDRVARLVDVVGLRARGERMHELSLVDIGFGATHTHEKRFITGIVWDRRHVGFLGHILLRFLLGFLRRDGNGGALSFDVDPGAVTALPTNA